MALSSKANQPSADILRDSEYNSFTGLDLTDSITNMQPGSLRSADNADILISGAVQTRFGYVDSISPDWTGFRISIGWEFQVTDSTKQVLVFGTQLAGNTGALGVVSGGVTAFLSSLSNNRPSLIQFSNLMFFFNGVQNTLYDGTVTRQMGINQPVVAPSDGGNIAGSLVVGAEYGWVYTYYNAVTGAESSPSSLFTFIIGVGGGRRINVSPGNAITADTIRLYRTTANTPLLFLDTTGPIASTFIDSVQLDAGLGIQLEFDNTRLDTWGTPRYAVSANNRIAVTGFQTPIQNRVWFSKVGQSQAMPESYQATGFCDCISNGGLADANIGLGVAFQSFMVLKEHSIGRIDPSGNFTSEIGTDNVIFQYNEISRGITGVSHWTITNVFNNMVWLSKDNVYMTDGTNVTPIATKIAAYIKTLNFSFPEKLSAINDTKNRKIMISVIDGQANQEPNTVLVGFYQNFPNFYWTIYRAGIDTIANPGIQPGCFFQQTQSDLSQDVYFGNVDYLGKLYHLNDSTNDDSKGIYFHVRDMPTHYNMQEEKKFFFKNIMFLSGNGNNYGVTVSSVYDLVTSGTDVDNLSVQNQEALWDFSLWDVAQWQEIGPVRLEYNSNNKATFKQLDFLNNSVDQPITIYGWTKAARYQEFK